MGLQYSCWVLVGFFFIGVCGCVYVTTRSHCSLGSLELRAISNHMLYFCMVLNKCFLPVCQLLFIVFVLSVQAFMYSSFFSLLFHLNIVSKLKNLFFWKIIHQYFVLNTCMILVVNLDPCSI